MSHLCLTCGHGGAVGALLTAAVQARMPCVSVVVCVCVCDSSVTATVTQRESLMIQHGASTKVFFSIG